MSLRTTALAASGALVLASLVYLALEVRTTPGPITSAPAPERADRASRGDEADSADSADQAPAAEGASGRPRDRMGMTPSALGPGGKVRGPDGLRGSGSRGVIDVGAAVGGAKDPTGSRAAEASRLYDTQDYEGALKLAKVVLTDEPTNPRVRRVAVSAACVLGETETARTFAAVLRGKDLRDMQKRCDRYGVTLDGTGSGG